MQGGVTNKNYKLIIDGCSYAIRIAGAGTENYIDREKEFKNVSQMSEAGVAPKIYYSDVDTGFQVSEFIEGQTLSEEMIQSDYELLRTAVLTMKKCHNSGAEFYGEFNPIEKINVNLSLLKEKNYNDFFAGWEEIKDIYIEISENYKSQNIKLCPCHNDTLAGNFIGDKNLLKMIDWEYSGMNDPYYDLACFAMENKLSEKMEKQLLIDYNGGNISDKQILRFYENKFITIYYWSVWSLLQIAYGKDRTFYYDYGMERFKYISDCIVKIREYLRKV